MTAGDKNMTMEQLAQGCLLGAFIGDAAGARLEFLGRPPNKQELAEAMAIRGGGRLRVAPGQITDDGELTLAVSHALVGETDYPREKVAASYRAWAASSPFDMGNATRAALSYNLSEHREVADAVALRAAAHNMESKANGALMRASALGIWSTRTTQERAAEVAQADARLTHPNPTCQWANAAYVVAIRSLVLHSGDETRAFADAQNVLTSARGEGPAEVMSWLKDASTGRLPAVHPQTGFVRIAFTHAFHHMLRTPTFEQALHEVLALGGDTDTNGCILGALVGARVGINAIHPHMTQSVLNCDTAMGRKRPDWLSTRRALDIAIALLR